MTTCRLNLSCESPPTEPTDIGDSNVINQELLDILACPKCKTRVQLDDSGRYLVCSECRLKYPINEQDIPILLIDRAEKMDS